MDSKEVKVLIFSIGSEYYAADIMQIERILGYDKPTELPDCPNYVEGVKNYEGNIIPILSLSKKFNIPSKEHNEETKIIVAKDEKNKVGIIVDVVLEVKDINIEDIEEAPEIAANISKRYIKGLIKMEDKIVIFLNLSSILTDKEKDIIM